MTGNWNYPTSIRFGAGRLSELGAACGELGIHRPLLVTDAGLAALPIVAEARQIAAGAGLALTMFTEVTPNPVGPDVQAGVDRYREAGCDGVIAFGGGSALDVGKAVALMVGQTRPIWDFEDVGDNWTRVDVGGMAPVVAVPTTSGTGSEVGRSSVIIDDTHTKRIIFHPGMLPARVICDPALTVGLPAKLTAAVGMDALSHNLEAFCVDAFHPLADGIALEGMRRVHRSLERAVADGSDLEARADMMAASTMGATAFQKGLGAMHALSHPIGSVLNAHHGLTNAIVMPYVLTFNRPAIADKMAVLSRLLELPDPGFDAVLNWVLTLREAIGIPHTLQAVGMTEADVARLVPMAVEDPTAPTNPVPLGPDEVSSLYLSALSGR